MLEPKSSWFIKILKNLELSEKLSNIDTGDDVITDSMRIFLSLVAEHEQFIKTMEIKTRPNEENLKTYIEPQGRYNLTPTLSRFEFFHD